MRYVVLIALLCSSLLLHEASAQSYKPRLKTDSPCAGAADRFLCEALLLGKELLESQLNCEVFESYSLKDWDGNLINKSPEVYYVTVRGEKEIFHRVKKDKIGNPQDHPDYINSVYSKAGWYEIPSVVFNSSTYTPSRRENKDLVYYQFRSEKSVPLSHNDIRLTVVMSSIYGEVAFDRKSKLLKIINYRHDISEKERSKHKFSSVEETLLFDNPAGLEEYSPVPVKFTSKMEFSGRRVIMEVSYFNYRRFTSDVVFKEEPEETYTLNFALNYPQLKKEKLPQEQLFKLIETNTKQVTIRYKDRYVKSTAVLYQVLGNENYFLTNQHCFLGDFVSGTVSDSSNGNILTFGRNNVFLLEKDVAVIKIKSGENLRFNKFNFAEAEIGKEVFTSGFPGGIYAEEVGEYSGKAGIVVDGKYKIIAFVVSGTQGSFGSSGSGGFNDSFEFIGLKTSQGFTGADGTVNQAGCGGCVAAGFFINGVEIYRLLQRNRLISR